LPLLRQGDGIAVRLGGARWPCRRLEASGRCALEQVGEPRGSPRRQRDADEEREIQGGDAGFPLPRGATRVFVLNRPGKFRCLVGFVFCSVVIRGQRI
jgi:hypothetical protein